ncbi:MAG: lytic transglycosylase domain-containing protein [Flavobacteriales bacterium]|nr:lytic transglycosylase domain-containing protein [Flavobacteriales bacterium]
MKRTSSFSPFMILAGMACMAMVLIFASFTNHSPEKLAPTSDEAAARYESPLTPERMTFAGEEIPTEIIDVREKLDREMLVNSYWHSNTFLTMKRAHRWFPVIEPLLQQNGIPEDFKYLAVIESGLTQTVSPAGATGFWQFLKSTGQSYGLEVNTQVDERYHVEKATEAACDYLRDAYEKYHDWALVAASYNMGMGGVDRALNKQKVDSYWDLLLNSETERYVYRIAAVKQIFSNPEAYGFVLQDGDLYAPYETEDFELDHSVSDLATFALELGVNYKVLKTLNPWLRSDDITVSAGNSYTIKLPVNRDFTH